MKWRDLSLSYKDRLSVLTRRDPWELLGVDRESSVEDVRQAYLRMVRAYHPDGSDPFIQEHGEEVLKLVNVAYERVVEEMSQG